MFMGHPRQLFLHPSLRPPMPKARERRAEVSGWLSAPPPVGGRVVVVSVDGNLQSDLPTPMEPELQMSDDLKCS